MGWNTDKADFVVPLQLTPSLEQYVCKRNERICFVVELGVLFAETNQREPAKSVLSVFLSTKKMEHGGSGSDGFARIYFVVELGVLFAETNRREPAKSVLSVFLSAKKMEHGGSGSCGFTRICFRKAIKYVREDEYSSSLINMVDPSATHLVCFCAQGPPTRASRGKS
jgi:hypothetical protein